MALGLIIFIWFVHIEIVERSSTKKLKWDISKASALVQLFSCWDCNPLMVKYHRGRGEKGGGVRGGGRMVNQFSWLFTKQSWGVVVYLNYPSCKTSCLVAHQYLNPLVLTSGHATYWAQNPPANKGNRTNHKNTSLSSENLFPECSLQAR